LETRNSNLKESEVKKMVQQGDVNIVSVVIPVGAKKRESGIIREGETTGHAHKVVGSDFEVLQLGSRIFARILSGDCQIVHEEHKPINLPVGDYEFFPTHEYDHFAEEARYLRD
jgi:hypothetical protein